MTINTDGAYMARALRLAELGRYTTMPNPRVGCVLVKDSHIIGEGWHKTAGDNHAEIMALAAAGDRAQGSTAYVTLEPCSHQGKTGPCSEALIAANIKRLVYAMEDPNPKVAGQGLARLRDAGVEVTGPLLEDSALALNPGFIQRMVKHIPYVRCKMAMSLDGRTAMTSGESKWVTSRRAREDVQRLRARSCAVISSVDTVLFDDASLTVRKEDLNLDILSSICTTAVAEKQPLRVILDSSLRLSEYSKLIQIASPILLVHAQTVSASSDAHEYQDKKWPAHVELLSLPATDGKIDLRQLLLELGQRECNEVLLEAGPTLAGSFLRQGLLDEIIVYMAPKLLGSQAKPLFELPLQSMAAQLPLSIVDIRAVGSDWRITAKPDPEG